MEFCVLVIVITTSFFLFAGTPGFDLLDTTLSTSHIIGYGVSTYIRTGAIRERTTIG
jgi:hypothetical protein